MLPSGGVVGSNTGVRYVPAYDVVGAVSEVKGDVAMKVYGMLQASGKTPKTQGANTSITSWVQTEQGRIEVVLSSDGTFGVYVVPVEYDGTVQEYIAQHQNVVTLVLGNVNEHMVVNMTGLTHREYVKF